MGTVSIIMCHWGMNEFRSQMMRKSLDSLIETTKNVACEIIIVDNGGSLEDSHYFVDLVDKKKIQFYIKNSENLSFGFGRNQGLDIACGDYIVITDNDIEYKTGWIEKCIDILETHNDKKILVTPLRTDREHRNHRHWAGELEHKGEKYLLNMRAGSNSWMMRRRDYEEIGKFRHHYIAGSLWNDSFTRKGYLMVTMEKDSMAQDLAFKKGYNTKQNTPFFRKFTDNSQIQINN